MTTPKEELRNTCIVVLSFVIYLYAKEYFREIKETLDGFTSHGLTSYILTYFLIGLPIFSGTYFIIKSWSVFKGLGVHLSPLRAIIISLIFTAPMLIGGFLFFEFSPSRSFDNLIAGSLGAGFFEELYFRGFLFGMVYRYTRLGFLTSIVLGALIFASGHLYQSSELAEVVGIFAITFMGAFLFAWLFVEWNYNLWIPIWLHTFMNLAWLIFEMDDTALGGMLPNILRVMTIVLAIGGTILYKKKKNLKMKITKDTLIFGPPEAISK